MRIVPEVELIFQEIKNLDLKPRSQKEFDFIMEDTAFKLYMMERHGVLWISQGEDYVFARRVGEDKDKLLKDFYSDPKRVNAAEHLSIDKLKVRMRWKD